MRLMRDTVEEKSWYQKEYLGFREKINIQRFPLSSIEKVCPTIFFFQYRLYKKVARFLYIYLHANNDPSFE